MLVPVEWLRDYVDFDITEEELADRLTMSGLEVEDIIRNPESIVFSTYVTPNRPDLLSITGVARDISALLNTEFRYPHAKPKEQGPNINSLAQIENRTPTNCLRYSARIIQNIKVCESPEWMQKRLLAAGMRPINNVVDATNYVMLEMGQPLHAFDYDLINQHKIIIREAYPGEMITTIDGIERKLNKSMMVIADGEQPIAIAGIMGGSESEVTVGSSNILLESANFNRLSVRKTARELQMSTEASFRYERNVDPELTIPALDRVTDLILQTGGGVAAAGIIDIYPNKVKPIQLIVRQNRLNHMLGFNLSICEIAQYLQKLGMETDPSENAVIVSVPTFRPDVQYEEDLIEEVGRIHGYDLIPTTLPIGETMVGRDNPENKFRNRVSGALISMGMQEVITGSMTAPQENHNQVAIRNPITDDLSRLRDNLLLDMLNIIAYNNHRGTRDLSIFQIGHIFLPSNGSIIEKLSIAGTITGSLWDDAWNIDKKQVTADFFTGKGILENLFDRLRTGDIVFKPFIRKEFHPGRTAAIEYDGAQIGILGEISDELTSRYDLSNRVIAFELDFGKLMSAADKKIGYAPLSKYPAVTRDIAIVIPEDVSYDQILRILEEAADELLESLTLFDVYTGPPLAEGEKSMAFEARFRSNDRTLRDEDIEPRIAIIKEKLSTTLGAKIRDY